MQTPAPKWTTLPKGSFTGIAWARPGATKGFDPYLVWAEASHFAGYADHSPKSLTVVIELATDTNVAQLVAAASPKWLEVPPVYTSAAAPAGLRFCTARVKPDFFKHMAPGKPLAKLVKRFELGMPLGSSTGERGKKQTESHAPVGKLLAGKVLGLIDNGLAFANRRFLTQPQAAHTDLKARTAWYWRQDPKATGVIPAAMAYGAELSAADIDLALKQLTFNGLVDEDAVYRHFQMGMPLQKSANHGTHVMDLAGGPRTLLEQVARPDSPPSWDLAEDDASRAPIVAVQLDFDTVKDPSGGSVNAQVLDGLMYILSRCDAEAKIAVNISWGTLAGPHDGSSVLEAAMDQLIKLKPGHLEVVLPAGNGYQSRTHANKTLSKDEQTILHWRAQPVDLTQNFLEIWIAQGAQGLEIEVTPPGHTSPLPALKFGESGLWVNADGEPLLALVYPAAVATGEHGTCALLAVAPTFSFTKKVATAPSGVWTVKLTNRMTGAVTFDAYVERDDDIAQLNTGARQSHLKTRCTTPAATPDHLWTTPATLRRFGAAAASTALQMAKERCQ